MVWEAHVLPRLIDLALSDRVTKRWRQEVCAGLHGEVLELGFGSGPNLRHYPPAVTNVLVVEPNEVAWKRAQPHIEAFGRPVERIGLDGAHLQLADTSVDAVLSTYTLCTIPDLESALAEVHRVLRPGGQLHFVEHGLAPDAAVARWQQRLQPLWGKLAGGCHITRDIPTILADAGFTLDEHRSFYAEKKPVANLFSWLTVGRAGA